MRYAETRHNIGFQVLDAFAKSWSTKKWQTDRTLNGKYHYVEHTKLIHDKAAVADSGSKDKSMLGNAVRFLLVKPYTYMNNSGRIIPSLFSKYALSAEDITVIYDTLDMSVGRIRLKRSGSSGGHRGLASIINIIGQNFQRIAIGIGRPPYEADMVQRYVLSTPNADEELGLSYAISQLIRSYNQYPTNSFEQRMEYLNRATK